MSESLSVSLGVRCSESVVVVVFVDNSLSAELSVASLISALPLRFDWMCGFSVL